MPSLFQPPDVPWTLPSEPVDNATIVALREAILQLRNEPDDWASAVANLRSGLETLAGAPPVSSVPPPAYYAATAAKVYLRENQPADAAKVLELGLRLDPLDPELAYLIRVLGRTQPGG